MSILYKFLNQEIVLSNTVANTVYGSTLVRLVHANTTASAHVVTQKWANGSTKSSFTIIYPTGDFVIQKIVDDTLLIDTGSDVKAAPVAFTN
jgi:hypothetical protein